MFCGNCKFPDDGHTAPLSGLVVVTLTPSYLDTEHYTLNMKADTSRWSKANIFLNIIEDLCNLSVWQNVTLMRVQFLVKLI